MRLPMLWMLLNRCRKLKSMIDLKKIKPGMSVEAVKNLFATRTVVFAPIKIEAEEKTDDEEEPDYEQLYNDQKELLKEESRKLAEAELDNFNLNNQVNDLLFKLSRIENQFDMRLEAYLIDAQRPVSYIEAVNKVMMYNRDWFITVMLSEEAKVKFAQALVLNFSKILREDQMGLISSIANRNPEVLKDISFGKTSSETNSD